MAKYTRSFDRIGLSDIALVGGKNASLGQMISQMRASDVRVPAGFAVTTAAYWYLLECNALLPVLRAHMSSLDHRQMHELDRISGTCRTVIEQAHIPDDLAQEIIQAYTALSAVYGTDACDVAIRSSASAEDSPEASFAGQQDSFLHVVGSESVLHFYKKSVASLFTSRAIVYRIEHGFDHFKMAISVGVQKMVRSDKATSGVLFTLDPETGFKDVIVINAAYGLGENVVQGRVTPDEFYVYKPAIGMDRVALIKKRCGEKQIKRVYEGVHTVDVAVPESDRDRFCLTDAQCNELARYAVAIEKQYTAYHGSWLPLDIEWAQDGLDGKLYIIQARPETVHRGKPVLTYEHYLLQTSQEPVVTGQAIGHKVVSGTARVIQDVTQIDHVQQGDIIVTTITNPDWVPVMKKAAGIITTTGGRTCHAAIVGRELGIAVIVGAADAFSRIQSGMDITLDASKGETGYVYAGKMPFTVRELPLQQKATIQLPIYLNMSLADAAFKLSFLPVAGVGLVRLEFLIAHDIGIHPLALLCVDTLRDAHVVAQIRERSRAYASPRAFFIETVSQAVGTIAAAFFPRMVTVRFSDFKSSEYRQLIGGAEFEPVEENPMLGLRGASRYYHPQFRPAFELECQALQRVYEDMGFKNIQVLIPFVRTVQEVRQVRAIQEQYLPNIPTLLMCETPADVVLIDELSAVCDGFSIGSNDLTQTTLCVDRNSSLVSSLFNERDSAVLTMLKNAVAGAHRNKKPIGICGVASSDLSFVREVIIPLGIDSISVEPDAIFSFFV